MTKVYCHKTTTFPTKVAAQLALLRMADKDRSEYRVHPCKYHKGFHLTRSRRGKNAKRTKARRGRPMP